MRIARWAALAGLGLAAGCGQGPPPPSPQGGSPQGGTPPAAGATTANATSLAAAPTAPAGLCTPGAGRCLSDDAAELCSADGQRHERAACDGGTLCVEGRCVSLATPTGPIDRGRLHAIRGDGWLNGWGAAGPYFGKHIEKYAAHPEAALAGQDAPELSPRCGEGGFVSALGREKKLREARYAVLAGYLVSGKPRPVALTAGVRGGARVFVNGALALATESPRRPGGEAPFQDEIVAGAALREGVNPVVILVEQAEAAPAGLWLRVREQDGRPTPDLLFAPASKAPCPLADLIQVRWDARPTRDGFAVEARARAPGLLPRGLADLAYEARLERKKGEAEALARGTASAAALGGEGAAIAMTAPFAKTGSGEIRLALGGEGGAQSALPLTFRGDLHRRIVDLEAALGGAGAARPDLPSGSRDSFTQHVETLTRALAENHQDLAWLKAMTKDAEAIAAALGRGEDPYRVKTGVVHRAYRSKLDGALQPYPVFVPPSYKPDGPPVPLVIAAHGLDNPAEVALRTVIGEAPEDNMNGRWAARHLPAFPDQGAILAAPWAYGNAGPRHLGEHDVLAVVDEMLAHYRIDPRRVSITGYSLGGTVAFTVPLHYPDRFSASAPLCGYPNLKDYRSVRGAPRAPWEDRLIEQRYIVNYAENGLHLPLHVVHGGKDGPERSRVVVNRYKQLDYSVLFDVQEDLDHNVWDHGYEDGRMIAWLTARKRPEAPARARLVTWEHRYDRAFWVRLILREDGARAGEIDARWIAEDRRFEVTTRNVTALALDFAAAGARGGGPARVVIDGAPPIEVADPTGEAFFVRGEGRWERAPAEPSLSGRKRPGVSGPLDDAQRHPQLIVYGTQDPGQIDANRLVAEHLRAYDTWAAARYPVKADAEVTEEELTGRTLVLVGGPASNRVTALFAGDLPVKFDEKALTLRGKRHEGEGVGVSLIWPHPRDPAEYLVLHAGVTFRGTLYSRHLPRLVPDYVVYDARITAQKGELLMDRRVALDGGFFGERWD